MARFALSEDHTTFILLTVANADGSFHLPQMCAANFCSWAMLTPATAAEIKAQRQSGLVPEEDADISTAGVAVSGKKMEIGVSAAGQMIFTRDFHQ